MEHVGVASWFRRLCNAQSDFTAKERIVWVEIEGVPLNAWTRSTFQKISSKWGELVELEDGYDDLFARKRIYVPEKELFSDDESAKINEQANNLNNDEVENASELVSDIYFGDNGEVQGFKHQHGESNDKEVSSDPFNIYDLLDKRTKEVRTTDTSTSIPYPPGFTPANDIPTCNNQDIPEAESVRPPSRSARSNSRVLEEAEKSVDRVSFESFSNGVKIKEGGSILEILEEMITVGQTMGFSMEGLGSKAKKDWIKELISKHKLEGFSFTWAHPSATKMSKLDRFLMSNGLLSAFPLISAICLDRHPLRHGPILLQGQSFLILPYSIHFIHSWLELLDSMTWSQYLGILLRLMIPMILELESPISNEDIRTAVWGCGVDKSPGPDDFALDATLRVWAPSLKFLILKLLVSIVLSVYWKPVQSVTKILASRLPWLFRFYSDVQTAFLTLIDRFLMVFYYSMKSLLRAT
ncbi:hypothetical protein Tco_1079700 [Tanacetum coccineum]|uniref:DUF4283 domain-containing protein n=1 Tax=Tanacetum coccineum TaxID=301880 RepID=A0ABQ5HU36_9ASTR